MNEMRIVSTFAPYPLPRYLRVFAWLSLIANVLIIGTGGAVRLTGSGLGCPTWPTCVGESIVNTPEMGIHGFIEFGNRTLTGVLALLALAVVVSSWRLRKSRRDLLVLSLVVLAGVIAQAIVGGITVLTGLNPLIVGFHYVASVILVVVTTVYLVRAKRAPGHYELNSPVALRALIAALSVFVTLTIIIGVLTTASGPHSGDATAPRTGYNAELLSHFHAWPGYVTFALALALLILSWASFRQLWVWSLALFGGIVVQIGVGLIQANTGLPPFLVGIHMVLAAIVAAFMTVIVTKLWSISYSGSSGSIPTATKSTVR